MDTGNISSLLAILLLAVFSRVDASGTIEYFNVSSTRLHENTTIVFKCGATLQQTEDGSQHSLIIQIRKWFPGSIQQWLLTSNEVVEISSVRHRAKVHNFEQIREVELKITNAMLGDSGNYTCEAGLNSKAVFVDVVAEPSNAMLIVNSAVVGQVDTNPAYAQHNRKGEQFEVQLDKSYPVTCIVMGGNPPPAVSLSSGMMPSVPYEGSTSRTGQIATRSTGCPIRCTP